MKFNTLVSTATMIATAISVAGCTAMMTLPNDKLSEAASSATGKVIKEVSNVRSTGDVQSYDALASDGKRYTCSLSVVMGLAYQHQKCSPK